MRVLVIGATGTIGRALADALSSSKHEVVAVTRNTSPVRVNIADAESIRAMYRAVGPIDAMVSATGTAKFMPLAQLADDDFAFSLGNKLMGQVNLIRFGFESLRDNGAMVVTSGLLARSPMQGGSAISLVNAGLEGFARAAALEAPRGIRVNVVSPPWVTETMRSLGMDTAGGLPATTVAQAYVRALEGRMNGEVIEPKAG